MSIMNDVNSTTSELSILPEPALKKMAIMHKNDVGMFSLIMAEDGRRKAMRAAAMARMARGPQPTIADQSISQMGQMPQQPMPPQGMPQQAPQQQMPPQAGIPALPAQNVQGLAGGGIVALAEGGMPDDGQMSAAQLIGDNEPVIRMAEGGDPEDQYIVSPDDSSGTSGDVYSASGELLSSGDTSTPKTVEQEWKEKYLKQKTKTPEVAPVVAAAVKERATNKETPPPSAKNKVVVTPPAALAKQAGGIEDLIAKFGGTTTESIARDMAAAEKASNKETDEFYRPEREKLQQQQEAIANRGNSNIGNALLRAGLGMMGGKSQYAMQNIAEGATQGLNAYQEAQKYDNAAQQANQHSQMLMIQAQRSERIGNKREAIAQSNQARQFQQAAVQLGLHAKSMENTAKHQDVMGNAAMITAKASATRANAMGDNSGEKLDLARQRAAAQDPEYKSLAAKIAIYPASSPKAIEARTRMAEIVKGYMPSDTDTIPAVPSSTKGGGVDPNALANALKLYAPK
jgi:hypothetical protein